MNLSESYIREEVRNTITIEYYLNEALNILKENEEESRTFTWDIAKEKIDKSKENIKTKSQAINYLEKFFNKIKNLPKNVKLKLSKYVLVSMISVLGINAVVNMIPSDMPEIKKEIQITSSMAPEISQKEEPVEEIYQKPTEASDEIVSFLKHEEGQIANKGEPVLKAYKLGDGMVTIGWGHAERISNSNFSVGQEITREKAEELLASDIEHAKNGIDRLLARWEEQGIKPEIDQQMYDAMISMAFNMGVGGLLSTDFILLVKDSKFEEAKEKILTTKVSWAGHVPRRKKESELFGRNLQSNQLAMNEIRMFVRKVICEERKLGKQLSNGLGGEPVVMYRAVEHNASLFLNNDYVTLSKKFAIEHAENNHIVYETKQKVIKAIVSTSNLYEAYNPGEYFYSGPKIVGETIYESKGYEYEGWDDSLLDENVGPGPYDVRNISDIMADMSNKKFNSPDFNSEYDPDNEEFLSDEEYDLKIQDELPNHEFDKEIEGYKRLKKKLNWKNFPSNKRIN